jgi:hypothetical protein
MRPEGLGKFTKKKTHRVSNPRLPICSIVLNHYATACPDQISIPYAIDSPQISLEIFISGQYTAHVS